MRIVTDYMEFDDEVKMITDSYRLLRMGLMCSTSMVGYFIPSEMDEVLNFCEFNRGFHIVSFFRDRLVLNRYHPQGDEFRVAEGGADPNFALDWSLKIDLIKFDLVNETRGIIDSCRNDLLRKRS